ncbi:MAG: methyltransferase domain-containing protein [Aquificota bacterium]|nr:MAG: methyltransferase domain-containing protein [Aquificota bacterium]
MRYLRPTSNKVRQALFNILFDVNDKSFLDLFAGTGEIGITALKKGAKPVYFVEIEKKRTTDIKKKALKFSKDFKVITKDVLSFLKKTDKKFDIIFADPPYNYKKYEKLIEESLKHLNNNGIFILEHRTNHRFDADEERKYGDTVLSFWQEGKK